MGKPSNKEEKVDRTTTAARAIINAEANLREQKTAKLRQMRLEKKAAEAAAPIATASPPRKRKRPAD
jgi:hypothetical protein